jgi:hypothetical protein
MRIGYIHGEATMPHTIIDLIAILGYTVVICTIVSITIGYLWDMAAPGRLRR